MDQVSKKTISAEQAQSLFDVLKTRFEKNRIRHSGIEWDQVRKRLESESGSAKLWSLNEMELSGGEPDVVGFDQGTGEYIFFDCAPESPKGRRSVCYDKDALESRKEYKPQDSAMGMASKMGIKLLTESRYRELQQLGQFDTKTSSWIETPPDIRKLGGAIFGDWRYGCVFIYHNGAESYYAARGFRGSLSI